MLQGLISPESFAGNGAVDLMVQERLKWQRQQQPQPATDVVGSQLSSIEFSSAPQFHGLLENVAGGRLFVQPKRQEAFLGSYELPKFGKFSVVGTDLVGGRVDFPASDCRVEAADMAMVMKKEEEKVEGEAFGSTEEQKFNKRKTEGVGREEYKEKRIKTEVETESSFKAKSSTDTDTSKQNSTTSQAQKPDYIHVRARRGQATDSHSLAERARREKISKKMKCLQDLVPGCNRITGKAGMLDEIINYVQSLQRQVEFLSMKLAALNPSVEFNPSQQCTANCMLDVSMDFISAQTPPLESTSSSVSLLKLCPDSLSKICQAQSFSAWDNIDAQALLNLYNFGFN